MSIHLSRQDDRLGKKVTVQCVTPPPCAPRSVATPTRSGASNLDAIIDEGTLATGWVGLDGVILLAYIIAIPANEIVVPTMLMVYMGVGMMTDVPEFSELRQLLVGQHGWTLLTALNLMLFSLLHNPCATTILTIYKETKSKKWATLSVVITLGLAFLVKFLTASLARWMGWV